MPYSRCRTGSRDETRFSFEWESGFFSKIFDYTKTYVSFLVVVFLLVKFIASALFSSDFQDALFLPFVRHFVSTFTNPYDEFVGRGVLDAFPYPPLMLYLLALPTFLIDRLALNQPLTVNLLFKLPQLAADAAILWLLWKMYSRWRNRVVFYYFFNPVLFYAVFLHSQLDLIPTFFLILTLFFLIREKNLTASGIALGLALLTKTHIALTVPVFLLYVFKRWGLRESLLYATVSVAVVLAGLFPLGFSEGFVRMVLLNQKQLSLFEAYITIQNIHVILPLAAVLVIYFHMLVQKKVNADLLLFYLGIQFTILIMLIYPSPGWFVWHVPFLVIYLIQYSHQLNALLFHVTYSSAYLLFFLFFHTSDHHDLSFLGTPLFLKWDNPTARDVVFTTLQAVLAAVMYAFYRWGWRSNSFYRRQSNLVVGIGGDSGSGKSTLMKSLRTLFGRDLLELEGDADHRWQRGDPNWERYTHLDPRANDIYQQAEALLELKRGRTVLRQDYDHRQGTFTEPRKVFPRPYIFLCGLHPFYLPRLRTILDLKIYLDTDESLRRHWKIVRDVSERGHSPQRVLEQLERRRSDAEKHIHPQKRYADLVIRYFSLEDFEPGTAIDPRLGLEVVLSADHHIEWVLPHLGPDVEWDYNEDLSTQYIRLKREPEVDFYALAQERIVNFDELFSSTPHFGNGYEGFLQLLIASLISQALREDV